ncbi:hypothetical protein KKA47_04405 [bacterium]|nr:hypothetical protein [bacterium]
MNNKAAIIGDRDSIWAFEAFGFTPLFADRSNARDKLATAIKDRYGIILITEDLYEHLRAHIKEYKQQSNIPISVIPNLYSNKEIGENEIRTAIRKAVGIDIV